MTGSRFRIQCGNSLELMRLLEPASIDCVITDPPYSGFEFTGSPSHYRHALHPYLDEIKRCVRDLRIAEVLAQDIHMKDGKIEFYRTKIKLSFKYHA